MSEKRDWLGEIKTVFKFYKTAAIIVVFLSFGAGVLLASFA